MALKPITGPLAIGFLIICCILFIRLFLNERRAKIFSAQQEAEKIREKKSKLPFTQPELFKYAKELGYTGEDEYLMIKDFFSTMGIEMFARGLSFHLRYTQSANPHGEL